MPITNARYAINAANARWGSLYDALYGTDALGDAPGTGPYDPERGARVIAWVRGVPRRGGSAGARRRHGRARTRDVVAYRIVDGALTGHLRRWPRRWPRRPGRSCRLHRRTGSAGSILLEHHGLGIEIVIDRAHAIGSTDAAGVADVVLESALTSIMDFEDSIAAVDSADKALAYHNWLGLMTGTLTEEVTKAGSTFTRRLAARPRVHRARRIVVHSPRDER